MKLEKCKQIEGQIVTIFSKDIEDINKDVELIMMNHNPENSEIFDYKTFKRMGSEYEGKHHFGIRGAECKNILEYDGKIYMLSLMQNMNDRILDLFIEEHADSSTNIVRL